MRDDELNVQEPLLPIDEMDGGPAAIVGVTIDGVSACRYPEAPRLIYVSNSHGPTPLWHRASPAPRPSSVLAIAHAVSLCGVPPQLDADEFGRVWAFSSEAPPGEGALCPKCHRIDQLETAWRLYPNDALSIRTDAVAARCRSPKCQAPIWRGVTRARGKEAYFDIQPDGTFSGTLHWRTCLDREAFQHPRTP